MNNDKYFEVNKATWNEKVNIHTKIDVRPMLANKFSFDLYKKTEVSYKEPFKARTSYERDRPGTFEKKNSYYLVSKAGTFYELPSSKSKIIKAMNKKEKEIKSFIKKYKTDLKVEEDLVKLVKYYNSLLEIR